MKYIAGYLLAVAGGNKDPSAADIEKILKAGKVDVDMDRLKAVVDQVKGRDVESLIEEGAKKMISFGGGGAVAATSGGAAPEAAAPKEEEKKEEESAPLDLADMFGDF